MTKFGAYATNLVTPVGEQYLQISPQFAMGTGEHLWGMGWFYMPFAGHLTVELYAELDWHGDTSPAIWFTVGSGSSPAPNGGAADPGICYRGGVNLFAGMGEMRTHAYWLNLASGAGVYAHARLYTTGGGNVRHICGLYRPMPS
jgi:hypothetical protein